MNLMKIYHEDIESLQLNFQFVNDNYIVPKYSVRINFQIIVYIYLLFYI